MRVPAFDNRSLGLLLAAAALVAGCGGGDAAAPPVPPPAATQPTVKEALQPANAEAVAAHFRERLAATRATGGVAHTGAWAFAAPAGTNLRIEAPAVPAPVPTSGVAVGAPTAGDPGTGGTPSASSTLLQEAGVDEEDVVRTDGDLVHALSPNAAGAGQRIAVFRAAADGTALSPLGTLALDRTLGYSGLYVDAPRRRLVAVGSGTSHDVMPMPVPMPVAPPGASAPVGAPIAGVVRSAITLVDVADPTRPRTAATLSVDGTITASRVHDGRLWLVVRSTPRLDGFDWSWAPANVRANQDWLAALTADRLLPTWRVDDGPAQPLLRDGQCYLQPAAPGGVPSVTTVVAVDLADPLAAPRARCLAAPVDTVYLAPGALYLATQRWPTTTTLGDAVVAVSSSEPVTDVHRFVLSPTAIDYRGSGSAPGRLSWGSDTARFMLSASGDDLRVLTQRNSQVGSATSPATLTVLRDGGEGALRVIASLPNARRPAPIGKPGEQVHGVRFIGQRGYVVTFRRVDPVYVLDLADPTDPKLLGELEVPGFSDRLYPLNQRLLLGVGRDTVTWQGIDYQTGVLVSVIDVSDPTRPVERARRVVGKRGSTSAADSSPHGTMIRAVDGRFRIALPVTAHETVATEPASWPEVARWAGFTRLAAFRWEFDPATGTLTDRAPVVAAEAATSGGATTRWRSGDARFDRAIDVGDTTWFWYDGRFTGAPWR